MDHLLIKNSRFLHILSGPFIWSVLIAFIIMDLWIEIYHRICFPLYGLKYIERSRYIRIDRHKLLYLNWIQKLGCMYCGYGNGLIAYWTEIAGTTERYWCGIQHQKGNGFISPEHHKDFLAYNDKESFLNRYLRK